MKQTAHASDGVAKGYTDATPDTGLESSALPLRDDELAGWD
jgi:hypothetical protein